MYYIVLIIGKGGGKYHTNSPGQRKFSLNYVGNTFYLWHIVFMSTIGLLQPGLKGPYDARFIVPSKCRSQTEPVWQRPI